MTKIDLDTIEALDVHVHAVRSKNAPAEASAHADDRMRRWAVPFKPTAEDIAVEFRKRNMACVVFPVDDEFMSGETRVPNEEVAEAARANPDVLIPFASINPHRGKAAVAEARDLIENHGIRGFKFHPSMQSFFPDDPIAYPLYEVIEEAGLPAVFHSGQTGSGKTLPGGGGVRLKYSNPLPLDDVAADFPGLTIVIAHPSFPWQQEALAVAVHKERVYIDLSGWSPKYFPDELVHYANSLLKNKVLYGSDFPVLTPERWLSDYDARGFKPELRDNHLKYNAARMLGLVPSAH
jgi:predicted TIM-barrel fold metal-dependent hydrolase